MARYKFYIVLYCIVKNAFAAEPKTHFWCISSPENVVCLSINCVMYPTQSRR